MTFRLDRSSWGLVLLLLLMPILATAQNQTHIVKRGDTLYGLGRKYGMSVQEIQSLNNLESTDLRIGQVLKLSGTASSEEAIEPEADAGSRRIQASSLPADYFYQIKRGDNLYRIALKHDVTVRDIVKWNNFANQNAAIFPGQRIIIRDPARAPETSDDPGEDAPAPAAEDEAVVPDKFYQAKAKDTLYGIARKHNMTVAEIKRLNSLSGDAIRVGQKIRVAGSPGNVDQANLDRITEAEILTQDRIREDLASPLEGTVLSEYGLRNGKPHKGIDIGAKNGSSVHAVLDGTVVYSGSQGAYGNVIVLEHPDFVMTVYAHNEKNLVVVGDKVTKGQQIATVGNTGNATCSHLHFEYRIRGKAINPRKVLPPD